MADKKYYDRSYPADGERQNAPRRDAGNDPLAELARLIGQTDPFAGFAQSDRPAAAPDRAQPREQDYYRGQDQQDQQDQQDYRGYGARGPADAAESDSRGAPAWMRNFSAEDARYEAPAHVAAAPDHERYDDVLYGRMPDEGLEPRYKEADPYEEAGYPPPPYEDQQAGQDEGRRRRRGMLTVGLVLALAVAGTAAAYGYRTYFGSARVGEPPVIKADTGPTKVVPVSSGEGSGKTITDRIGDKAGGERVVSREEQPVEVRTVAIEPKPEPRVVLPTTAQPFTQPAPGAPPAARQAAASVPAAMDEPRRVRTITIRGDQPDAAAQPRSRAPAAVPAASVPRASAQPAAPAPRQAAPASTAGGPMQIAPQPSLAADSRIRTSSASAVPVATGSGGAYMVQLSSQRNEADAQASYRALQGKYPGVLGSRQAVIRRADLGDKGVYYRAMVGPFGSSDEAVKFCANLKAAGGQCVVPR
ncbi:MAG: SPOR domain-containing protein [Xanthobacteraceae bacterium]|nr:MAG: SPOR domain-containing protein [Xanthobacteraceae bacterium]